MDGRVAHLRRGCGGRGIKGQDTIRGELLLLLQPSSKREQIQNFGFRGEKLSCERKKELEDESCWVDVMKMCRRRNISALLRDKL